MSATRSIAAALALSSGLLIAASAHAGSLTCIDNGASVLEGASGSVTTTCANYDSDSIVPTNINIISINHYPDTTDRAYLTGNSFSYGASTHPGIIWNFITLRNDNLVNVVVNFSTDADSDAGEIIDNGLTEIRAKVLYHLVGTDTTLQSNPFTLTVVVQDVPEPGAWSLMLAGTAAVGAGMRRRRTVPLRACA